MWLDLWKPSMHTQKLKSILLLIICNNHIAMLLLQGLATSDVLIWLVDSCELPAMSRHSNKTAIDKQVCFYRWPFVTLSSHEGPKQTLWSHLGTLTGSNYVCSTVHLLGLWYDQCCCGNLSGPLYTQLGWLCLLASLNSTLLTPTHPLICGTLDIAGCVQSVSQNQPIQQVVMYVC